MLAYLFVGLAVLHPSMRELGTPVAGARSMLTQPRLFMFGAASLIGPAAFMFRWSQGLIVEPIAVIAGSSAIFFLMVVRMWTLLLNIRGKEEHFRSLVQNSSDGIVLVGPDSKLMYVSDAASEIVGVSAEEMMTLEAFSFVDQESLEAAEAVFGSVLQTAGAVETLEVRIEKAGEDRLLEVDFQNLLDHPSVGGVVVNFRDITERHANALLAAAAESSFRDLFNSIEQGVYESDPSGRFIRANHALAMMLEYDTPGDLLTGAAAADHYVDPEQRLFMMRSIQNDGRVDDFVIRARTRTGRKIWCSLNVTGVFDDDGKLISMQGMVSDITERHRAEEELRESEERFRSLVQNSADAIVVVDHDFRVTYLSPSLERIADADHDDLMGRRFTDWFARDEAGQIESIILSRVTDGSVAKTLTCELKRDSGESVPVEIVATNMLSDSRISGIVFNLRDVSERVALEDQLRHQAFHDPLTGLANRALFLDRLSHALQRSDRSDEDCFVLFLDLDDFKRVNDSQGHNVGDECLKATAQRLLASTRASDTVARMGGDEFAILMEGSTIADATLLAERILQHMSQPLKLSDGRTVLTPSIGISSAIIG